MISHRHKCLYVTVPKCASTTIHGWFSMHGGGWRSFKPWWYGGVLSERIQEVVRIMNLYPGYATFTFVRNPYERFVSIWLHARRIATLRTQFSEVKTWPDDYGTLREFAELCGELHDDFRPRWGCAARDFFQANAEREYGPRKIRLKYLAYVASHARPQTDFLPDCHPEYLFGARRVNGDPLSFIGTVENIDSDFSRLAEMLGLPDAGLPDLNSSGVVSPVGNGSGYAGYYDDATRQLVEEIYAADLAFTGCGYYDGRTTIAIPSPPPRVAERQAARRRSRSKGMLLARIRHRMRALEIRMETQLMRLATARRLFRRPVAKLRGLPRWPPLAPSRPLSVPGWSVELASPGSPGCADSEPGGP